MQQLRERGCTCLIGPPPEHHPDGDAIIVLDTGRWSSRAPMLRCCAKVGSMRLLANAGEDLRESPCRVWGRTALGQRHDTLQPVSALRAVSPRQRRSRLY
jgi:hypothetical protein